VDSPEISEATGNLVVLSETTTIHDAEFIHRKLILTDFLPQKLEILWSKFRADSPAGWIDIRCLTLCAVKFLIQLQSNLITASRRHSVRARYSSTMEHIGFNY